MAWDIIINIDTFFIDLLPDGCSAHLDVHKPGFVGQQHIFTSCHLIVQYANRGQRF